MADWGYVSYQELRELKIPPGFEIERDIHWEPRKAGESGKIRIR